MLTITISGEKGEGKTLLAAMLTNFLEYHGSTIENVDDPAVAECRDDLYISKVRLMQIKMKSNTATRDPKIGGHNRYH